ncbi:MAG: hypothetical protein [Wendovervirus sonii]|uniref:Antirestriction protein n=1 Tax=phage Lak_Megaphage_Sonny TaxID=3109229 RepID=A0ABZ0Z3W0_9CAUD|nr:MAG: hypothetical protein [phage Lak_Megaphage_Sonny]
MKNRLYESIMQGISKSLNNILNENKDIDIYEWRNQCKIALGDYYNLTEEESINYIDYNNNHIFTYNDEEWFVFNSYESAKDFAIKYELSIMEDENVFDYINFDQLGGLEQYVDKQWFDEWMEEDYQTYIDDIQSESASSDDYKNRLEEEMAEAGCENKEDFLEHLIDTAGDSIEHFMDLFGKKEFGDVVKEKNLIDLQSLAEDVIEENGISNTLASYDGNEVELIYDCYAYRQN